MACVESLFDTIVKGKEAKMHRNEGDTPPFWYAVFRGVLGRTQYAKGQYAVRNNSVKSYAALKNSHF